jgi:hypothetical protein
LELLCWNRVKNYETWLRVFKANLEEHREKGRRIVSIWRDLEDPSRVFFVFELETVDEAKNFLADPSCAKAGQEAGVLEGEAFFVGRVCQD